MLKSLLIILSILILTSCSKECGPKPPKIIKIKVPTKCIVSDANCTMNDKLNDVEVVVYLLRCISIKNKALKVCSENNTSEIE